MIYLRIKNWESHQHYKDRNPPWIKLHREVLDDYEMTCLQDASKLHLILIWVLASQQNGRIPNDPIWVAKKIGATGKVNLKELIDKGFLIMEQDASNTQAECSPETYREETDTPPLSARAKPELIKMLHEEIPSQWAKWAIDEKGWDIPTLQDVWSLFREYWQNGKGRGTKREQWEATWHTWCRKENLHPRNNGNANKSKIERAADAIAKARAIRESASPDAA